MSETATAAPWTVMKFGGTSVASRPNWEAIASLARDRQAEGFRVLLVCAAVAGVPACLNKLADRPAGHAGLNEILGLHRALLFNEHEGYLETFRPYALPDRVWVEEAGVELRRLVES